MPWEESPGCWFPRYSELVSHLVRLLFTPVPYALHKVGASAALKATTPAGSYFGKRDPIENTLGPALRFKPSFLQG